VEESVFKLELLCLLVDVSGSRIGAQMALRESLVKT
jgi:hypothetical protein